MPQFSRRLLTALIAATLLVPLHAATAPVRVIFDTDMGNDIDDALALGILHALETRGEIPIGLVKNGKTPKDSPMIRLPSERKNSDGSFVYPRRMALGAAPDAVVVLRQVLAHEKDASVVIVQVGFSTNLARLLDSPADAISPLNGAQLVAQKVHLLVAMAGHFPPAQPEFNVATDIPSAQKVFAQWPSPVVFSGFEIGQALLFPASSIEHDFNWTHDHPVVDAYRNYMHMPYDRPTWDLTAALYAVRPEANYFSLSPNGTVRVDGQGNTLFTASAEGKHRYLILDESAKARTLEALILLASQPRIGEKSL